ncbi:MAG: acetate--CoA ligase family protein [Desulfosudaceae bacterium]
METDRIITAARQQGQRALSEYAAKQFLAGYDIPVTREILTAAAAEAVAAADEIGYPVALKACGASLLHKSDRGLVALNVTSAADVQAAHERLCRAAGEDLEGVLVQEMVTGQRELVVGMNRDPQFGPCVMLGLGGVMTEIFRDTAFRMAPIDMAEAADMTGQLRCRAMLDAFRGEQPADREALCRCLVAVGRISLDRDDIEEIDINPLIITRRGDLAAVDALIILKS